MNRKIASMVIMTALTLSSLSLSPRGRAADSPNSAAPTKHQLMKDCMAKQMASDSGMPKFRMRKVCKDLTSTEHENLQTEKQSATEAPDTSKPTG